MLTMTAQNLKDMAEGIPADDKLPRVFKDAIKVTRSLKIKYLWIDALCIAQGDMEEWKTESLLMREIYPGAHVTISADAASTCDESFLTMPDREWRRSIYISGARQDLRSKIFAQLGHDRNSRVGQEECVGCFGGTEYNIHSRGWALQEALLSPRLVSFCFEQVYFGCEVGGISREDWEDLDWSHCVDGPSFNLNQLCQSWLRLSSRPAERDSYADSTTFKQIDADSELSVLWWEFLNEYAPRTLSEPDDRLPAISGLASHFKRTLGLQNAYCAGLWSKNFVRECAGIKMGLTFGIRLLNLLLGHGCLVPVRWHSHGE
ncbi:uncharacterized protein A1O5_12380 [Cladophialophora psammophila CBS 110553]|uniref:Heterokaryon incompatibility domain-containing protein n=1 Tax=Cladophialophora psammophila CBS 110553 TaxID=1182543 RepID=W9VQ21_9EURO|nr:uncharacterized protein A1O5_12380 [Cladophialophora psammophila CBS 110553]EXJ57822.1 hypothetical protein A1O5_12380 [Cladophialophora psammophila CBS 110553]